MTGGLGCGWAPAPHVDGDPYWELARSRRRGSFSTAVRTREHTRALRSSMLMRVVRARSYSPGRQHDKSGQGGRPNDNVSVLGGLIGRYRQSTVRTSTGSRTPLSVSMRGSDSVKRAVGGLGQDGARREDLPWSRSRADASGDMHALPGVVATPAGRLGHVKPDPDRRREAMLAAVAHEPALDVDRTVDRVDRAVRMPRRSRRRCGSPPRRGAARPPSAARGRASPGARSRPRRR